MQDYDNLEDFFQSVIKTPLAVESYQVFDFLYMKKNGHLMACQVIRERDVNQQIIDKYLGGRKPITVENLMMIFNEYISKDFRDYTGRSTHPTESGQWVAYSFFIRYSPVPIYSKTKKETTPTDKVKDLIVSRILLSGKEGATLTDIQKVSSNISSEKRKNIIKELLEGEYIIEKQEQINGSKRPTTKYFKTGVLNDNY